MEDSLFFGRVASLKFETPKVEAKEGIQAIEAEIIYLTFDDIDFECSIDLDNTNNSNKATINIYNLPANVKNLLVKNTKVTIAAGYEDEDCSGTIFFGIIEKYRDSRNGNSLRTEIICTTANDEMKENKIKLSFGKGVKASTIINTVISKTELKKGEIKLGDDKAYERGRTFNNHLKNIFSRMARDTKSRFYISNRVVYFYPVGEIKKEEIECLVQNITSVEETDEGWKIKTKLDHRIEEGVWLIIDFQDKNLRQDIKGKFEVTKVRHSISEKGNHETEMEILTKIKEEEKVQEIKINGVRKPKSNNKKPKKGNGKK